MTSNRKNGPAKQAYLLSEVFGEGGGAMFRVRDRESRRSGKALLEKVSGSRAMDFEGKILGRLIIPEGGMSRS